MEAISSSRTSSEDLSFDTEIDTPKDSSHTDTDYETETDLNATTPPQDTLQQLQKISFSSSEDLFQQREKPREPNSSKFYYVFTEEENSLKRYSDLTLIEQYQINKAAVYVDMALNPKGKYAELSDRPYAVEIHWVLHNSRILRQFLLVFLLFLAFFEVPSWCFDSGECVGGDLVPQSNLPRFSILVGLIVEFFILWDLCLFALLGMWRARLSSWKSHTINFIEISLLVASLADVSVSFFVQKTFRLSPLLRPFIFISMSETSRRSMKGIVFGMKAILHLLLLEFFWIFFMAWIGCILFQDVDPMHFDNIPLSMLNLLILITTANFPDVAIGALNASLLSISFFTIFVVVGLWFLMNFVLASIYSSYRRELEAEKKEIEEERVFFLKKAFIELQAIRRAGTLNFREMKGLFKELNVYIHIPYINHNQMKFLFTSLDLAKNGTIYGNEFLRLIDVLDLEFEYIKRETLIQRILPRASASKSYKIFSRIVCHSYFDVAIDILLLLNLVLIAVEYAKDTVILWENYELLFTSIFTVEMGLKVFAEGGAKEYWRKEKNRFDCSVTVVSLVTEVIIFAFPDSFTDHTITRTLQMARIARVLRLLLHFPPYQLLASTYISLLPQLFRLASVVFIIDYEFCLMGVAFYGGQINRLNPKLLGTDYLRSGYMMLNFNDVMSGFITLFALKIVNNWFVIMDAFVAISGQISRVYFVAYWLIAVVTTLSVVVATILDRFLVEVEEREKGVKHSNIDPMLLNGIEGIGELIKVRKRNLVSSH